MNINNKKCNGCHKDIPSEKFDDKSQRPTWFGKYKGQELLQWVCVDCWDKNIRHKEEK